MGIRYSDEFLISELHRFVSENNRNPRQINMQGKFGYPEFSTYHYRFGSFNIALEIAGLELNQYQNHWQDGSETCDNCGKSNIGYRWSYQNNMRLCEKCRHGAKYKFNNLSSNSSVGRGFISQRVVAKVLDLELKDDCNCNVNFGHPFDLYDKGKYNYINVKSQMLNIINNWCFNLSQKEVPDTYIMLGFDRNRKNIIHVWITDAVDDLVFDEKTEKLKKGICIKDDVFSGLKRAEPWEVDAKPYDDILHSMSLDNCSVLIR